MIPSSTWLACTSFRSVSPASDALLDFLVLDHHIAAIHHAADDKVAGASVLDADLAHHLTDDNLNVLIVDIHALQTVNLLHFADQVVLGSHGPRMARISCG